MRCVISRNSNASNNDIWALLCRTGSRLVSTCRSLLTAEDPVGSYTPVTKKLWQERLLHGVNALSRTPALDAQGNQTGKTVTYDFSSDMELQELYRNPWNKIRIGRVMEDLDSLAGSVAFEHCFKPCSAAPLLVTASVDEITLAHPISVESDITLQGQVAWTGSSSLDVAITLQQQQYEQPSMTALFSFVHLNPETNKPSPVPQLTPTTPQQQALFQSRQHIADERKRERRAARAGAPTGLLSSAGRSWAAPLLVQSRRLRSLPALVQGEGRGAVHMHKTQQQHVFVCQPQCRNTHGRIFGGYLMRKAYELGFAAAYTFSGTRPVFLKCDEITFKKPVDVGDLLQLRSQILYTATVPGGKGLICVEVEAAVTKPEKCDVDVTNTFTYVFEVEDHPVSGAMKQVLPISEEEAAKAWEMHQALHAAGYLGAASS